VSASNEPGDDDRRLPAGERRIGERTGERLAGQLHSTPTDRQDASRRAEPLNVWAHGVLAVGTRGRCRLVLIVPRCPYCPGHRPHVHNAPPTFTSGKRTASCRGGKYVVHVGTLEGGLAA
jgi:hypothetical protein